MSLIRRLRWCCGLLLAGISSLAVAAQPKAEQMAKVEAALPDAAPTAVEQPRKLLVYTRANGYVHASIPIGAAAIARMGETTGAYRAEVTDDPAVFEWDRLSAFDGIFLVSTTGDWLLPKDPSDADRGRLEQRRANLLRFVAEEGRGLSGCHACSDSHYGWQAYGECLGGYFERHPWNAGATVTVRPEEPEHALLLPFGGQSFTIKDEIYQFKDPYSRERLRVLLSLDPEGTDLSIGTRADGDYPVAWVRREGAGRVFYCSLGHNAHVYWDAKVLAHLLAGIQYALGDLEAADAPR